MSAETNAVRETHYRCSNTKTVVIYDMRAIEVAKFEVRASTPLPSIEKQVRTRVWVDKCIEPMRKVIGIMMLQEARVASKYSLERYRTGAHDIVSDLALPLKDTVPKRISRDVSALRPDSIFTENPVATPPIADAPAERIYANARNMKAHGYMAIANPELARGQHWVEIDAAQHTAGKINLEDNSMVPPPNYTDPWNMYWVLNDVNHSLTRLADIEITEEMVAVLPHGSEQCDGQCELQIVVSGSLQKMYITLINHS